ncbi:MAG: MarR family EPS-associated transcriptional regulator [Nitrospirae bacterium]|nr:MarR family EPS-associated transcriptional regulator [Nitrospirota bacterium]
MDESQFRTLRELAKDGTLSQRELSRKMGLSLGRVNYLVNALLGKGYIKAERFKNSKNKIGYMYILTPKGISTRMTQTYNFLQRKLDEFEQLKKEIEVLREEATRHGGDRQGKEVPWQRS